VFACGPAPLVEDAWDAAMRARRAGKSIAFHRETFEL
jgi:hypothetical protein